jgi:hypothetical protein
MDWQGGEAEELGPVTYIGEPPEVTSCTGDPGTLFYCSVPCPGGDPSEVCYNLCVVDECHIYRVTDINELAMIDNFIREVDGYWTDVETDMEGVEDGRRDGWGMAAACTAGASGIVTAALSRSVEELPFGLDPRVLTIVGIVGGVAGVAACVVSAMSWFDDRESSSDAAVEQIRHFNSALGYFNTLREVWGEAEVPQ